MTPVSIGRVSRGRGRHSARSGFTLMEMLSVITAMSALSVTGTLLVALMLTAETKGAKTVLEQTTLARIGRQLRSDAHQSPTVTLSGTAEAPDSRLELPAGEGRTVRWTAGADGVVREVVAGDAREQRESYRLPEGSSRFEWNESAGLIAFEHASPAEPLTETYSRAAPPGPERIVRIEAAIDIASRWERSPDTETEQESNN